jgi:hypothetical protein
MTRVKEYTAQYIRLTCLTGVTGQQRRAHQRRGCSGWRGIQASVQVSFSERLTSIVTSPEFWQRLTRDVSGLSQPRNARNVSHAQQHEWWHACNWRRGTYRPLFDTCHSIVALQIFVHIKAKTRGLAFEIVNEFLQSLPQGSVAKVEDM